MHEDLMTPIFLSTKLILHASVPFNHKGLQS